MIPPYIIEKVQSAANIEDVVSGYVTLRKRGANLVGLCPFHTERTPSFSVSPSKGIYKCFGCGKSGHVINFIMEVEQCSYVEAIRLLADKYHIEIEERALTKEEIQNQDDREAMFVVNDFANKWFGQQLWETDEGKSVALAYFYSRGISDEAIRLFQLGYSPSQASALGTALLQNGFKQEYIINNPETLKGTGLCYMRDDGRLVDRFRERVIFPIQSVSGKVVAFAGRILVKKEHTGKYVNSPDSVIYSKSNELFGLFLAKQHIAKADLCYLVEGQMDVIAMYQSGLKNVVASGGTSLTQKQIQLLRRFTSNITILYDGDNAGIHAATRGINMLLEYACNVKVVLLPEGEDPDSLSHKYPSADFINFIETHSIDFIQFKTELITKNADIEQNPVEKGRLIRDIIQSIACIPDRVMREVYIQTTAQKLSIAELTLLREVNKIRREHFQQLIQNEPTTQPNTPQPTTTTDETVKPDIRPNANPIDKRLEQNFTNLIQTIIRYGSRPLFNTENTDNVIYVGHFILDQLRQDAISFPNDLMQRIADEFAQHADEPNFDPETFFKFHNDPQISQLAIELTTDKYVVSGLFSKQVISENIVAEAPTGAEFENLDDIVPQLILELKETLIEQKIDTLQSLIKTARQDKQTAQVQSLLIELTQYMDIKKQLCKQLGNRIITK